MKALVLILLFVGCAIAVLQPLVFFGNARWGAGYGDLLNGGLGLGLMMLGGGPAFVMLRRQKRAGVAK